MPRNKRSRQAAYLQPDEPAAAPVNDEERRQRIALRAYQMAEQRGFRDGDPIQDWLLAEKEVDRELTQIGG